MYSSDFIKVTEAYERMTSSKGKIVKEDGHSPSLGDVALGSGLGALGGAAVGSLFGEKGRRGKAAAKGALIGAGIGGGAAAVAGMGGGDGDSGSVIPQPSSSSSNDDAVIYWDDEVKGDSVGNGGGIIDDVIPPPPPPPVQRIERPSGEKFSYDDGTGEYLRRYYGGNASEIERNAVTNRFGGVEQPLDRRAYNTTTVVPGRNSSEFNPSRPDPTNNIRRISGRSHAVMGTRDNTVNISVNDEFRKDDVLSHELGHTLNAQGFVNPTDRTNPDSTQRSGIGYLTGNDDEFGSFLGGVRRNVYKATGGAVDTANPSDFRKVMENPSAYGVREIDQEGFKELRNLMDYRGSDERIIRRRDELMKRIDNPRYMGQFVKADGRSSGSFASAAE